MRRCSTPTRTCCDDVTESLPACCASQHLCCCRSDLNGPSIKSASVPVSRLQPDVADVMALNVNVQSYKKLLEKNMLNDLSSPESADNIERVESMVDVGRDHQQVRVCCYEDKACQTTLSSVGRIKLVRSLKHRCGHVLCLAGWILCCPCWTLGYSLRDPPDYYNYNYDRRHPQQQQEFLDDEELTADPCWPCDNLRHTKIRRLPLSVDSSNSWSNIAS